MKAHPNFCPRETIRSMCPLSLEIADDSFISFIEITGFSTRSFIIVQLGKSHVEMYIGAPVGYPSRPPVFLLAIDRNSKSCITKILSSTMSKSCSSLIWSHLKKTKKMKILFGFDSLWLKNNGIPKYRL